MPAVPKRAPAGLVRELRWRPRPPCVSPGTKGRLPDGIGQGWVESSLRMYTRSPTTGERKKTSQGGVSITPKRLCLDHFEASAKKRMRQKKRRAYTHTSKCGARARSTSTATAKRVLASQSDQVSSSGLLTARCASALVDDVLARPTCCDPTSMQLGPRAPIPMASL